MRMIAGLLAAAGLMPATATAADRAIHSRPLRATVSTQPWHLGIDDARGRLLDELPETGPALPGTLAYASGGAWFHATRVTSERVAGGVYTATVATTNPLGPMTVRIAPDANGVLALSATAPAAAQRVAISFRARGGERFLGFGERSNAVDQRGNTVESYVAEGPYLKPERPALAAFVPTPGYHPRDDATYFPVPWLLSTAGYGVLLDDDERSEFHLASDRPAAWTAVVDGRALHARVFAGPTPGAALRRFTARVGRQPAPAAPWYFGPWFQPHGSDDAGAIAALRKADAP